MKAPPQPREGNTPRRREQPLRAAIAAVDTRPPPQNPGQASREHRHGQIVIINPGASYRRDVGDITGHEYSIRFEVPN
jgi:hypothetical protein